MQETSANDTQQAASGCGGCQVKTDDQCTTDLTRAAKLVVKTFVEVGQMFDRSDTHKRIVEAILAEDIRDDQGRALSYQIPGGFESWFFDDVITNGVAVGLVVQEFAKAQQSFDRANAHHIKAIHNIVTGFRGSEGHVAYQIPEYRRDRFFTLIERGLGAPSV